MKINLFFNSFRQRKDKILQDYILPKVPQSLTADRLCTLKFVLAIAMYFLIVIKLPHLVLALFLIWGFAKFLDILDGSLARLRGGVTWYGSILDGLTDRFVLVLLFYGVWLSFPLLSAFLYGIYFIFILFLIDSLRYLYYTRRKKQEITFWKKWGDWVEISFRTLVAIIALGQFIIFY